MMMDLSPFSFLFFAGVLVFLLSFRLFKRRRIYIPVSYPLRKFSFLSRKEGISTILSVISLIFIFGIILVGFPKDSPPGKTTESLFKEYQGPVVVALFDISSSIDQSRYELARQSYFELVKVNSWDLGLIVFSDENAILRFPNRDKDILTKDLFSEASLLHPFNPLKPASKGTKLREGLLFSYEFLLANFPQASEKVVIVFSDLEYTPLKAKEAFQAAKLKDVKVHLVIAGSEIGGRKAIKEIFELMNLGQSFDVRSKDDLKNIAQFFSNILPSENQSDKDFEVSPQIWGDQTQETPPIYFVLAILGIFGFWILARATLTKRIP